MNTVIPQDELTEYLYDKASRRGIPLAGTFELTPVCNFACRMCYVRQTDRQVAESPRPILKPEDWLRIAEEAKKCGMLYLLITGGEPFLYPDFWPLYEKLNAMGFVISINSNGSLLDEARVERLAEKPPRKISITLYGASDETYEKLCGVRGGFGKVDRAISLLQQAGIRVNLKCSLTPYNDGDLEQIIAYAKERDLELTVASYMFPPIRRDEDATGRNEARFSPEEAGARRLRVYELQNSPEHYRKLLEKICSSYSEPLGLLGNCQDVSDGRIRCRAGKSSFWITWDGRLTPCGMLPEPWTELTVCRPFEEAWASLRKLCGELRLSGLCSRCPDAGICHPCAAMSYAETGSFSGTPVYLCRAAKEMHRIAEETLCKPKDTEK